MGDRIVVVGAGETAEIAYEYFTHDSPDEVVAFAVESPYLGDRTELYGLPVVPLDGLAASHPPREHKAFVAISSTQLNRLRRRLYDTVKQAGFECASYVSSKAFVWPGVEVGENTFIFENNVLQRHVKVGDNVILWSGSQVLHRTVIRDDCFISSHVVIAGFCEIGRASFMGVNSCVGDELTIGDDCVVGAGAVVVKDLAPRGVYVGNPAKPTGRDSFETFRVEE